MKARTRSSSDSCSAKPRRRARSASKAAGQPTTMSKTSLSKTKPTFSRAAWPATASSRVALLVVPTEEELEIALEAAAVARG